jgi:hypothetical protein
MWNGRQRSISRRLERLEARSAVVSTTQSFSMMIHFVDQEKRVMKTLRIEGDQHVWSSPEAEPAVPASERIAGQRR